MSFDIGLDMTMSLYLFLDMYYRYEVTIGYQVEIILSSSHVLDMTMSLYLFLDMYLHSGEYHVGTVGIDIRNYIFAVLMR